MQEGHFGNTIDNLRKCQLNSSIVSSYQEGLWNAGGGGDRHNDKPRK